MIKQRLSFVATFLLCVGVLYGGNELNQIQLIQGVSNKLRGATSITITPDGKYVYAAANNDKAIAIFSRDASTGKLTYTGYLDLSSSHDIWPQKVIASVDSKYLYVKDTYAKTEIDRYIIGTDGSLSSRESYTDLRAVGAIQMTGDGKNIYAFLNGSYTATWLSPSVSINKNYLYSLSINESTGGLSSSQTVSNVDSQPYSIALSPSGDYAYVSHANYKISWYSRSTTDYTLTYKGLLSMDPDDSEKFVWRYSTSVIHESGKFYYGAGDEGVGGKQTIDTSDGSITVAERLEVLDDAKSLAIKGDRLYSLEYNDLRLFSISSTDGALTLLDTADRGSSRYATIYDGREVVVSPDGNHVYAASYKRGIA
ncbi:MAG: beta-propeller fold lactonase family protein, partial [Anaerolineales bacterium]|nr:beta-propeller fold lactonase family protein [Anaerolineales bacterium]